MLLLSRKLPWISLDSGQLNCTDRITNSWSLWPSIMWQSIQKLVASTIRRRLCMSRATIWKLVAFTIHMPSEMHLWPRKWVHRSWFPIHVEGLWHYSSIYYTVKNPQSKAIYKRLHQTIMNAFHPLRIPAHPSGNVDNAILLTDTGLSTALCLAWATISDTLKISTGALVFHWGIRCWT